MTLLGRRARRLTYVSPADSAFTLHIYSCNDMSHSLSGVCATITARLLRRSLLSGVANHPYLFHTHAYLLSPSASSLPTMSPPRLRYMSDLHLEACQFRWQELQSRPNQHETLVLVGDTLPLAEERIWIIFLSHCLPRFSPCGDYSGQP